MRNSLGRYTEIDQLLPKKQTKPVITLRGVMKFILQYSR